MEYRGELLYYERVVHCAEVSHRDEVAHYNEAVYRDKVEVGWGVLRFCKIRGLGNRTRSTGS